MRSAWSFYFLPLLSAVRLLSAGKQVGGVQPWSLLQSFFILGCRVGVGDLLELESLIHIPVVSSRSQGVSFWGSRGSEMLWCLCGALVCMTDLWSAPTRIVLLCRAAKTCDACYVFIREIDKKLKHRLLLLFWFPILYGPKNNSSSVSNVKG